MAPNNFAETLDSLCKYNQNRDYHQRDKRTTTPKTAQLYSSSALVYNLATVLVETTRQTATCKRIAVKGGDQASGGIQLD